ncbi:MAG: NUDIX hydrolase, partial [Desulfobacteraceae bacterium]|nr:NUDIX hydrolase [Desulfobacteraceae bacterium]
MDHSNRIFSGHYPNHPRVAVGAVVFKEDMVLLVLRGKPPAQKQWSIPGGCVELGETIQEAAEREIAEETGIVIQAKKPIYTFDVIERDEDGHIRFHYVIVDLAADYISGELRAGDDAVDVSWVSNKDLNSRNVSDATRKLLAQCYRS